MPIANSFASTLLGSLLMLSGCGNDASRSVSLAAQGVYTASLSNDSQLALVGSMNHGASLWRAGSHERLFSWNHAEGEFSTLIATAFSADGLRAATSDPRTLVVWDTSTGRDLAFWGLPSAALDIAVANDGRRVLLGLEDHSAILFDAANGSHLHTLLHGGVVGNVDIDPDGTLAITGSDDQTARLWDLTTGQQRFELAHENPVRAVALSADGRTAFTASQAQRVRIWDTQTGKPLHLLHQKNPGITSARFSDDGSLLLLGLVNRTVELYRVDSGQRLQRWRLPSKHGLSGAGSAVLSVGFDPDNRRYFAINGEGQLSTLVRS